MSKIFKKLLKALLSIKNETVHQLDIFGQLPSFTVLNKSRYTSNFGFIMSIIIGCLALYYLDSEIAPMIMKQKPSIYQSEIKVIETEAQSLTNSNFTLAVSIASQFSHPTQGINKYYTLNISQCVRQRIKDERTGNLTVSLDCQEIPIETCNMSHFTTELQKQYFSTIRLGTVQCIKKDYLENNPLILQGQFNARTYKYLFITFSACQNSTEFQECAPQEEINKILEAGQYNVYKSDYLTQLEHSGQPYEQIITNEFTTFSLSTSKTIVHSYRIMQTQTDQGLIMEDDYTNSNLQQSEWREISDFYNHQYLVCHYIKLDFKQTNIKRNYIKLQTILAKIGGILQILTLIVGIFLKPIIDNLMKFEIVSQLYSYEEDQIDRNILPDQIISIERDLQSPSNQSKFQNFCSSEEKIHCKKAIAQESCLQTFLIIFGFKKFKHNQFCRAKKKIIKNLDIVTILRKLQDIDTIKKIIFTQEQLEQLKKKPRPKIMKIKQDSIIEKDLNQQDQGFTKSNIFSQQLTDVTQPTQKMQNVFKCYIENQFQQYLQNSTQLQQQTKIVDQEQSNRTNVLLDTQNSPNLNEIKSKNMDEPQLKSLKLGKQSNVEVCLKL
ncbi:unnamed protein product [Paramecium sonneborni]|uniref:Transmembrane protein n=1 Tax=Paramecium sonneborni TaxID=65129 RepID=A0A8S1LUP3_9CILI|nr:unnamed protein product [Paramecium sonneborni]